jgi:glyceraldehyde-3-phosphate dehydrogenase (NADP+)
MPLQILAVILLFLVPSLAQARCDFALLVEKASDEAKRAAGERFVQQTKAHRLEDIPAEQAPPRAVIQKDVLIGGQIEVWNGPTEKIYSPTRVDVGGVVQPYFLGEVPVMDADSGYRAYEAARAAWKNGDGAWPSMSLEERVARLQTFLSKMRERRAELIKWIMWEIGKSEKLASAEVDRTIAYAEDTIREALKLDAELRAVSRDGQEAFVMGREPLGVVPIFAPYNYPLNETFTNLIPALLMGNTLVVKPARFGVLLMRPLFEAFRDSFPPGVVNFIYGDGREVFRRILEVGGFEGLGFIGGEKAAAAILRGNGMPQRTKATLGLGAKNMAVILNDADVDAAVAANLDGCLTYSGQRCTAHKMVFVQRGIAERFVNALASAMDRLAIGPVWLNGVSITASPDTGWVPFMQSLVDDATGKGALIGNLMGGKSANGFYAPTLLVGVTKDMTIYNREQFGPVVPVVIFDRVEEAIAWQAQSKYGQQAAIFGNRESADVRALYNGLRRKVGRVNLNSACRRSPDGIPFGARADSGMGTLSLRDALLAFTTDSVLCERLAEGAGPDFESLGR